MADTQPPPVPDHPWRAQVVSRPTAVYLRRANTLWTEDDYDRMELEAFVEKRS